MRKGCRHRLNVNCPFSESSGLPRTDSGDSGSPCTGRIVRFGVYFRKDDSRWIRRYRCQGCKRSFSAARLAPAFRHKKRRVNRSVQSLLCSGVSQRRMARLLGINIKTVARKLVYLAGVATLDHAKFLKSLGEKSVVAVQFDEMETFERSKCLPLSIPLVVLPGQRKILGFKVGIMPAKGPLAAISFHKYGPRPDERPELARALFSELRSVLSDNVRIESDQNPKYPGWIRPHFSNARHIAYKGRRGCVVGQGELKKIGFDPLFDLNHTCAMFRANVNRLFRRTWCTTKRIDRLAAHLMIYVRYHNTVLT